MFSKMKTLESMKSYSNKINKLKDVLDNADAILIGAGSGLSTSAGLTYSGERFNKYFSDFKAKYGITDIYSGGFYPFETLEEYWAWWSRHIWYNRYVAETNTTYHELLKLVENKDYFVITTNVDHQFQLAGFDKKRLYYMQGDYGLLQCSKGCHQKTYDNKELIEKMLKQQKDMKVPTELIPYCPKCGAPMVPNLRADDTFVQDEGWYAARDRYDKYVSNHIHSKIVYLELGIGENTPIWIKYPFWRFTLKNTNSTYVCINYGDANCPIEIKDRAICINSDILEVLEQVNKV